MTSPTQIHRQTCVRIELGWPSSDLSPNARGHWSKRSRASKLARTEAHAVTLMSKIGRFPDGTPVRLTTTFHPPARYRFDEDGLSSRMKPYWDGVSDALGIDDRHFRHKPIVIADTVNGGKVEVEIEVGA